MKCAMTVTEHNPNGLNFTVFANYFFPAKLNPLPILTLVFKNVPMPIL